MGAGEQMVVNFAQSVRIEFFPGLNESVWGGVSTIWG